MYFCNDVDLMGWEPGVFLESGFGHQAVLREGAGTLTGTSLVVGTGVLGNVLAGMVATVVTGDGVLTQLLEVVEVVDGAHATVSSLRGRASEGAVGAFVGGSVKVTVVSFRPQIGVVGDALLGLLGVASDRDSEADVATADLSGFRLACVFGVLAVIFRALVEKEPATNVRLAKVEFYEKLAAATRRRISGKVDEDGDGVAERVRGAGVGEMVRE